MRASVIFCIAFASFIYSEACVCIFRHPQTEICDSDFAIRAKILKQTQVSRPVFYGVIYKVKVIQHYKKGRYRKGRPTKRIYTASSSAECGSTFEKGHEYIITGYIRNNKWVTSSCQLNRETSVLTTYQKRALKYGYYEKNCSCNVCMYGECSKHSRNNCKIGRRGDNTCFFEQNSCRRKRNRCVWHRSSCL